MIPVPGRQPPWPSRLTVAGRPDLARNRVTLHRPRDRGGLLQTDDARATSTAWQPLRRQAARRDYGAGLHNQAREITRRELVRSGISQVQDGCRSSTELLLLCLCQLFCANQPAPSKWVLIAFAVARRFLRPFITSIGPNSLKMPRGVTSSS